MVITGLGPVSALGEGADTFWSGIAAGRSGIDRVSFGEGDGALPRTAAQVPDFDPEKYVTQRKSLKVMARDIQLAMAGASLAMKDAGLAAPVAEPDRSGVIVGAGVLNHELDELAYSIQNSIGEKGNLDLKKFGQDGIPALFPLWLLKYLPNMPACHISILYDLRGFNNTITTGSSAGLQAVGEAFRILERGDADLMLAGGADSKVNPVGISQYQVMKVLSKAAETNPKNAYKPFDTAADGFVVGEGAGFLVLEELEHAKKRGAKIYAEITGFGSSGPSGCATAMKHALEEAEIAASGISYLQACGLGIPEEDTLELEALEKTFGGAIKDLSVGFSKPNIGFTGFAAGALDLIVSTLSLQQNTVPPVVTRPQFKKSSSFQWGEKSRSKKIQHAMTSAFGFGGQSASMVIEAYEGV